MRVERLLPGDAGDFVQGFRHGFPLAGKADFRSAGIGLRSAHGDAAAVLGFVHADGADQRAFVKLRRAPCDGCGEKQCGEQKRQAFFISVFAPF